MHLKNSLFVSVQFCQRLDEYKQFNFEFLGNCSCTNPSVTGVQGPGGGALLVLGPSETLETRLCPGPTVLRCRSAVALWDDHGPLARSLPWPAGHENLWSSTANVAKTNKQKRTVQCDLFYSKMSVCGFDYSAVTNIQESHQVTSNHTIWITQSSSNSNDYILMIFMIAWIEWPPPSNFKLQVCLIDTSKALQWHGQLVSLK